MKCPDCGTEMKPLAFSEYCPNDCDRKVQEEIDPEKTEKIYFTEKYDRSKSVDLSFVGPPTSGSFGMTDEEWDDWLNGISWDTD